MDIRLHKTLARNIDSLLNERPDQHIIMRCVDCQTFLLPEELHQMTLRFKWEGSWHTRPFLYCPACYPNGPEKPESADAIPESTFIRLTREQYEKTKVAERWGLLYDPKTDQTTSNLLITSDRPN